ncbi:MAG: hypothetical protein K1W34_21440 [Lachnospiraceae bacterium]
MTEEEEACYNLITGRLDMSYSIYVLAVNQETPVYADFLSRIILHNEIDDYDTARYWKVYPFFANTKGILYSLVDEYQEGLYSSFPL